MTTTTTKPSNINVDDVSPAEIAAVESALRHVEKQQRKQHVLGKVAQWFLVLKMYKELEVGFLKAKNRNDLALQHEALLSLIKGVGVHLLTETKDIGENEFALISYSREALECNVRYLREKYEQWFVSIDDQELNRVTKAILDEREINPA